MVEYWDSIMLETSGDSVEHASELSCPGGKKTVVLVTSSHLLLVRGHSWRHLLPSVYDLLLLLMGQAGCSTS